MRQRLSRRAYVVLASFTTTLALASAPLERASAQEDPDRPPRERALDLFMQAEIAYEAGEVERAVALLVEARSVFEEPVLLFNLARAYETLGRIDDALEAYRRYLVEEPNAQDRRAIETRISALEGQITERERLREERARAERRARSAGERSASPVPWVVAGAGVAAVGVGIVLGVLALEARDQAQADPVHESAITTFERGEDHATAANVLFAAGGAVALAGLVFGIIDVASATSSPTASASPPAARTGVRARVALGLGSAWVRGTF